MSEPTQIEELTLLELLQMWAERVLAPEDTVGSLARDEDAIPRTPAGTAGSLAHIGTAAGASTRYALRSALARAQFGATPSDLAGCIEAL